MSRTKETELLGSGVPALAAKAMARLDVETVAATGSAIGDAAALTNSFSVVTASDGTKGVQLPDGEIGDLFIVHNSVSGQDLEVYPQSGDTINGGSAGAAVTVAGLETAILVTYDATNWYGGVAVGF